MKNPSCTIIIATYGDDRWKDLATKRAIPSAYAQSGCEIIAIHDPNAKSPAKPRNNGVSMAKTKYVCFLDADDEYESGYIDAMMASEGDIRYPMVRTVFPGQEELPAPVDLNKNGDLLKGNYMVIGTMLLREQFLEVGGYREFASWEDWFLLLQLTYIGARPKLARDAIYRVYRSRGSRVSVTDPGKLFRSMLSAFKLWAISYNGGITEVPEYQKFLNLTIFP